MLWAPGLFLGVLRVEHSPSHLVSLQLAVSFWNTGLVNRCNQLVLTVADAVSPVSKSFSSGSLASLWLTPALLAQSSSCARAIENGGRHCQVSDQVQEGGDSISGGQPDLVQIWKGRGRPFALVHPCPQCLLYAFPQFSLLQLILC